MWNTNGKGKSTPFRPTIGIVANVLPGKNIQWTIFAKLFDGAFRHLHLDKVKWSMNIYGWVQRKAIRITIRSGMLITFKYWKQQNRHFAPIVISSAFIHPCFGLISTAYVSTCAGNSSFCWSRTTGISGFPSPIRESSSCACKHNVSGRKATSGHKTPVEQQTSLSRRCAECGV